MGFFDTLFGGTETKQLWSPWQQRTNARLNEITWENLGQGVPAYQGQIAPGASANQQLAFNAAPGLLNGVPGAQGQSAALQSVLSGNPAYQIDPTTSRAYYRDAVVQPARQEFNDTLNTLDARYGARFGRSGGQQEAAYRAAERFNTNLGGILGNLVYQDEMARRQAAENAAGRQVQGLGMIPALGQNQRQDLSTLAALGGVERGIAADQNAEAYGKWQYEQPYNNPWLGMLGMALTPPPVSTTQTPGILPGVGAAAYGISQFF